MLKENYDKILLIKPGELMLKGGNRRYFENKLKQNLKVALKNICDFKITTESGRYYIQILSSDYTQEEIALSVSKVFGIVGVSLAYRMQKDEDVLYNFLISLTKNIIAKQNINTFKVQTKRADKSYPLNSMEMSRIAGGKILSSVESLKVDVIKPDLLINIEIRRDNFFVYTSEIKAHGGIPVGTSGRGLLMLSGGIDSPVAGYMMAKRGLELEAVYFHSPPYTSEKAKEKVIDLAKILKPYTMLERVHVVDFTKTQMEIYQNCPHEELTIIMRRVMVLVANHIAKSTYSNALITGESLGQVASQTIESLFTTNAASEFIVLRPLIGMDKHEIISIAKNIESYETSILPYEDCCTIFVAKHPKIKPILEDIIQSEKSIDIESLVEHCLENTEVVYL